MIQNNTRTKLAFEGTPLLRDVLIGGGFAVASPCGGKGTCGKCTVQTEDGKTLLSCQTVLQGDLTVILPESADAVIETSGQTASHIGVYGAAVDIGTTTVVCKVFAPDGTCVGERSCLNPGRAFASDVIGRIDAALRGHAGALQQQITDCIAELLAQTGCADQIKRMVITGNTAMLYLLTGRCPASIARAPFVSETLFGEAVTLLGIDTFLPPCMNAFVGADITCAVLASGMTTQNETALLCDIGTNGELALWKNGVLYITSTAAGPAFEGAEISSGCGGVVGAVDRVYTANGRVYAHTIGDKPAVGICGSGLIDAVAAFLQTNQIDETGMAEEETLYLSAHGGTVTLTQGDIRALQLAKAAVAAGIEMLLARSGTSADEVATVYLAGGFGNKLSVASAVQIGLLPRAFLHKTVPIGNAALSGAVMLLSDDAKQEAERIASLSRHVELGGNAEFNDAFVEKMLF